MKQSDIVKLLRKEFGHHEVTVFTASQKNRSGVLDCEIAYKGQGFWVEIKMPGDKLRSLQRRFIERHIDRSFVFECNPKESVTSLYGLRTFSKKMINIGHDSHIFVSYLDEYFSLKEIFDAIL